MSLRMAIPPGSRSPLPSRADVLVIGGGIMGLATAYNLARMGQKDILVVDQSFLCSGASGRNGGGVRMQWSSPDAIEIMRRSVELCRGFAAEMGVNVWFRQGGYLFLVRDERLAPVLEKNVRTQNECGVRTRLIAPSEARELVPELDTSGILAASYNPDDGVLFPWPFVWGYAHRAIELGVAVHTFVKVLGLEKTGDLVTRVHTTRGTVDVGHVVLATGAWSPELARGLGVELPNRPYRHEILTTEPLKPFLTPMVTVLGESIYFSQAMRGEIVGGMGDPDEPEGMNQRSSLDFVRRFARSATRLIPKLGHVQVVRQWAGVYDVSPDGRPLLGEPREARNVTFLAGFTGHGFMMAPTIGELCAERIARGHRSSFFEQHHVRRLEHGIGRNEETMIIG